MGFFILWLYTPIGRGTPFRAVGSFGSLPNRVTQNCREQLCINIYIMETEQFIKICEEASSMAEASRKLNMTFNPFKRKAIKLGCYKTNQNWTKGKSALNDDRIKSKYINELFSENSGVRREYIKGLIIKHNLIEYKCSDCGLNNFWNNKILSLQLDHINGIRNDNRLENLRFLCPNCHTQTDTWCSKNKGITINNLEMKYIIENINTSFSMTKLIGKLGLCDTKSNRSQIKKIMVDNNLEFEIVHTKYKGKEKIRKIKENKEYKCDCGEIKRKESKTCIKCYNLIQRKIIRPSIEILLKEIKELGYSATGKKYGVSDNSIRKWVKNASMV